MASHPPYPVPPPTLSLNLCETAVFYPHCKQGENEESLPDLPFSVGNDVACDLAQMLLLLSLG